MRQAGLRRALQSAGLAVCVFRLGELATQPIDFGQPIKGGAGLGPGTRLRKLFTCLLRFRESLLPGAVQLHQFGSTDQAMTAVRNQIRLRPAPLFQRRSPFLSPTKIENFTAGVDQAAVHASGDDGRDFSCSDRNHCLIEQGHTARGLSLPDQGSTLSLAGHGQEVEVTEALANPGSLDECPMCPFCTAPVDRTIAHRQEQITLLYAIGLAVE